MFDRFIMVDWSGGNDTGAAPKKDAIWLASAGSEPVYLRNRQVAEAALEAAIAQELAAGRRVMVGFDFPFGYPAGFAAAVCGAADPLRLWDWLDSRIEDSPTQNNRFDLAGEINLALTGGRGPFWGNGLKREVPGLARQKAGRDPRLAERRAVEALADGAFTCWQLAGAGAVGSQVLTGLPVLARLRRRFAGQVAVWPFEPLDKPVALVEIWPSLIVPPRSTSDPIPDREQVRVVAERLAALPDDALAEMLAVEAPEEGWILGVLPGGGTSPALAAAPVLRNDCFALPPGVDWVPVQTALTRLEKSITCVTEVETVRVGGASGRILAALPVAQRANPPTANSAVDGWGFAHAALAGDGPYRLPVMEGRAAAGGPFAGEVPVGRAIRILTGAILPPGVDTVLLDEDATVAGGHVAFGRGLKKGANTRRAGEDVDAGVPLLPAGHVLRPPDLALLAATGVAEVAVRRPLRVGVLSTGDEVIAEGPAAPHQIWDANRPMLLDLIARWGMVPVDLGHAADEEAVLARALDRGAEAADAVLTSGGASAGDEDHLSRILAARGRVTSWRIAVKPGRPLALGFWRQTPLFGLPGNPVAAFVCALIFARPALFAMAGAGWREPVGFTVPAAFSKAKKAGRREYLRARLTPEGGAEVFRSEGSGRISGLAWAEGLVELPEAAAEIAPGHPVRYLPYTAFGL